MAKILPPSEGRTIKDFLQDIQLFVDDEIGIYGELQQLLNTEKVYDKKVRILKITKEKDKLLLQDEQGKQYITIPDSKYELVVSEGLGDRITKSITLNRLEKLFNNGWLLVDSNTLKTDINDNCKTIDSLEDLNNFTIN